MNETAETTTIELEPVKRLFSTSHLPEDVEVLHLAPGHHGLTLAAVVTSPDMPECEPGCAPRELMPSYRIVDGKVQLESLGV